MMLPFAQLCPILEDELHGPLATGSNEESSVQLNGEACGHRVVNRGLLLYSA